MTKADDDRTRIAELRADVAALQALQASRWGRVPHVATDPVSPPDGAVWLRSDTGQLSARISGTTKRVTLT